MTPAEHRAEAERLLLAPMPTYVVIEYTEKGYVGRRATAQDHANIIARAKVHAILGMEK